MCYFYESPNKCHNFPETLGDVLVYFLNISLPFWVFLASISFLLLADISYIDPVSNYSLIITINSFIFIL